MWAGPSRGTPDGIKRYKPPLSSLYPHPPLTPTSSQLQPVSIPRLFHLLTRLDAKTNFPRRPPGRIGIVVRPALCAQRPTPRLIGGLRDQ